MILAAICQPSTIRAVYYVQVRRFGREALRRFERGGAAESLSDLGYVAGLAILVEFFMKRVDIQDLLHDGMQ